MKRTFAIGDIHGAYKALLQVLERANVLAGDRIVFLGDYVDGWSQSREVMQFISDLGKTHECIYIMGNHDEWCEEWIRHGKIDAVWKMHGGKSTMESFAQGDGMATVNALLLFNNMKRYWIDEKNRLFVHAGYTSMHGPAKEHHLSNFSWDRTLWEMARTMKNIDKNSAEYPQRLRHFEEIFIGHTPTLDFGHTEPMHCANVWNLDTGAAFTGRLTIMDVDTKEFWQSDVVKTLYPNELGRNKIN